MVGRQVVSKLLERGVHVTALLRAVREAGLPDGVTPVHGDIRDRDSLALAAAGAEVVFHLAAKVPGAARTLAEYRDVNVAGTPNTLDAAKKARALRFVHVSSVNVDRYARGLANDAYSKTKWEAESLVLKGSSGKMECVVVRSAIVFGPGARRSGRLNESFVRGRV
jgi:nucleoside-diphosphate-sugar epimerase